ncbi:hypothetical protein IWW51_004225 [Coemansia sp. RSA 2702]|nr:hypothetical protein IWW51_004225 [Coemansia sp. RSA 2702]KAJ2368239.1 hypothetical protein H4S01_001704 [Coemansia sp. RSA 2610]
MASESSPLLAAPPAADQRDRARRDELKGYVFMAASALGFAANTACVKALALADMPALQIVLARSIGQLALGLAGCAWYRASPLGPPDKRAWLALRGAAGALGNALFFYAITVMALGDATVVFFTSPVFSALFAHVLLGEPYGIVDVGASAVCMVGIVLVVQPAALFGRGHVPVRGALAALGGAVSGALAYCVVRRVGRSVHAMVHVVYFGFVSLAGSSLALYAWQQARRPASLYEWALLALIGGFAFVGQVLLNRGLQLAPAGPGTLMRNLDVVFAFVLGVALFGEVPSALAVAGAGVIVACTVAVGLHKWHNAR